ncbi:MAG: HAMP domain-containing protein, partial [Acidobacteriota bacterium]|nr:HAMP domain-containing protein [Acidobacteriota bacterium]
METNLNSTGSKWRLWLPPLLLGVCFYLLFRLGFSGDPFFERVIDSTHIPGKIPEVRYQMTTRLFALFGVVILLIGVVFQMMRQWAAYFLNRKIIVSYLFFAVIPLGTTLMIFFAIIRSWFGITSTLAFDKTLDQHARALENFTHSLQAGLRISQLGNDLQTRVQRLVTNSMENELSNMARSQDRGVEIAIYLQPEKHGSSPRLLINMYRGYESDDADVLLEDTPAYERVIPSWLQDDVWTGVTVDRDSLYLRRYSREEHEAGVHVIILVSERLDGAFLDRFQEHQAVRVIMHNEDRTNYYATEDSSGKWYTKLLLKPLGSEWESMGVDWESGFYEHYGEVRFDLPGELGAVLGEEADLPFFYVDQKKSALRFILGIIMIVVLCEMVAFVFGGFLVSYITRSLNTIAEGHERVSEGSLAYRLPYIGRDQLGNMGRSFNGMIANIESLMTQVTEKEKYYEELRIARDIQMSLLPNLENLHWCSNIAAHCIPARDVGGDYYEV